MSIVVSRMLLNVVQVWADAGTVDWGQVGGDECMKSVAWGCGTTAAKYLHMLSCFLLHSGD